MNLCLSAGCIRQDLAPSAHISCTEVCHWKHYNDTKTSLGAYADYTLFARGWHIYTYHIVEKALHVCWLWIHLVQVLGYNVSPCALISHALVMTEAYPF